MYTCPKCNIDFDINDRSSTHQVNDINEETYCSCECSEQAMLECDESIVIGLKKMGLTERFNYLITEGLSSAQAAAVLLYLELDFKIDETIHTV